MIRKVLFGVALALFLAPAALSAQNAIVTGRVRSQTLAPVAGAYVSIPEVNATAVTNDAGVYRLLVPGDQVRGQEVRLVVQQIGFRTTEATFTLTAGVHQQDVALPEQAITLNEVVVTGTAGRQERKAQAAVVSTVDAAALTQVAPISSVANLLQARTPGVSLQQTSGTSGTAQTIRFRGAASISLSNEPLVFIDGVRADSRSREIYGTGGQQSSRLNDINPDDIESIEVVKGPAAATLYGADASAGVIHIITKKGRAGGGFSQSVSMEYHAIDQNWTPFSNFGVCSATMVADSTRTLCYGKQANSIVEDNPLIRTGTFRTGELKSLGWSARGGGENYGFFLGLDTDQEDGTLPNNFYDRASGRFNFDFIPSKKLRIESGFGLIRTNSTLPQNDNNIYGYLGGAFLGFPTTRGRVQDGWYGANRFVEAISAIENSNVAYRIQPRMALNYTPVDWFTNRLIVGADMTRERAWSLFPRNSETWYASTDANNGTISEARASSDRITIDYLGNLSSSLTPELGADLSFGSQLITVRSDITYATGVGMPNRTTRSVDAAATRTGGQNASENRSIGFFGQLQLSFKDRLYAQVAGRMDQNSAFGHDSEPFFSPKVGVSYVVSDEPAVREVLPGFVNTMRLRAAYGTTGRSPTEGIMQTYNPAPYAITTTVTGGGLTPRNPGNDNLKPERGTELEAGFEAGFFDDRLGLEVTYFNKVTRDLILETPLPASTAYSDEPFKNIGEVVNRGFEVAANANLVTLPRFGWSARVGVATLHNEINSMVSGADTVAAFGTVNRFMEGYQTGAFVSRRIRGFEEFAPDPNKPDSLVLRAVVADSLEFLGNFLPTFEGSVSSTMNFFGSVQLYAQAEWKTDFYVYNGTDQFRERQNGNGERWIKRNDTTFISAEERVRRFGPFIADSARTTVNAANVNDAYIEPGDFLRLREVALTYTLPREIATRFRASGASITLAGRDLALWTKYSGPDPEVNTSSAAFGRQDFLTLPRPRRWVAKVNFQF